MTLDAAALLVQQDHEETVPGRQAVSGCWRKRLDIATATFCLVLHF